MKRFLLPASTTAVALAAVGTGVASAQPTTAPHARAYERAYHQVVDDLGAQAPGRNIVQDGLAGHRRPSDAQTVASLTVLQRMLTPSTPAATSTSAAATSTSAAGASSAGAAGTAGVPSCAAESGSDYSTGASNTNPTSGATGRYQILPSTASAYGCNLSTPAGQDACAQTIYEHQGAGAWVGCGG